jgi:hypothetical protein
MQALVSKRAAAQWVSRIAASAGVVWVLVLAVKLLYGAAHIDLVVPLPDVPTAAFMITFYGSLRMIALRVGRAL